MLIVQGTKGGRTKELFGPVPSLTKTLWSCDDPDTLGWLQDKYLAAVQQGAF